MASVDVVHEQRANIAAPRDAYDAVVVGAGIAGMTAGALLAHAGESVLVVESDEKPGGYAHALSSDGYIFDRADHLISSCEFESPFGQGVIDAVLRELRVRDQCEFVRVDDPFYVAHYPGFELAVPCGREPFLEAHVRHFPREAAGLRRLVELSAQINREILALPMRPRLVDLARMPMRSRTLVRYGNATLKDVIDRELSDPRLKALYATLWLWLGLPPSQASFLIWAAMMASYIEDGAYYCRGSYDSLAAALVSGLENSGGELLLGTPVSQILTDGRAVTGITLGSGERVAAAKVISAIDARTTFEQLLAPGSLPARLLRRIRRMDLSPSMVGIYLGTDLDPRALGAQHENSLSAGWDHEQTYVDGLAGNLPEGFVVIPSLTDPSVAPPGKHTVIVHGGAARESGETPHDDARLADRLLSVAEQVLPGLRDHLTFVETTAQSPGHPTVHRMGPIYGWAVSPSQSGLRRLAPKTPIAGLVLAGQWTQPGHGIFAVVESGIQAARLALGAPTAVPPLPLGLKARARVA